MSNRIDVSSNQKCASFAREHRNVTSRYWWGGVAVDDINGTDDGVATRPCQQKEHQQVQWDDTQCHYWLHHFSCPARYCHLFHHCWSRNSPAALLKFPLNWLHGARNPEVHYRIHKDSPINYILNGINPIPHITTYFIRFILILSSHLTLGLPRGMFPVGLPSSVST